MNKRPPEPPYRLRLKEVRESKRLSQTDLAKLTGLKPSAISHFETSQRTPCLKNLILLCIGLNCSPNDLLKRED